MRCVTIFFLFSFLSFIVHNRVSHATCRVPFLFRNVHREFFDSFNRRIFSVHREWNFIENELLRIRDRLISNESRMCWFSSNSIQLFLFSKSSERFRNLRKDFSLCVIGCLVEDHNTLYRSSAEQ